MLDVSVVIPHYNNHDQVMRAYKSVMAQSALPREIIIVDDCSQDISYLNKLEFNHNGEVNLRIIYFKENGGPSRARNYAVSICKGSYIAFLDADDVWHYQKLEIMFNFLIKENIKFIFHKYLFHPPLQEVSFEKNKLELKKIKKNKLIFKNYIFTPTVILRKDGFIPFPENFSFSEDFTCWFLNNNNDFFYYIDLPLANGFKNPIGESGLSSNIYKMHKGFIKALGYLRKEKKISLSFYLLAIFFEYIKFPIRYFR